ncbi:MAG: sulfotransferase [Sphingomonadales bacterium]|nr:sulfotransferase [Sphingomonadales bacterium]
MDVLTPDQACAAAVAATGLADFGGDDFQNGLARSLSAFATLPLTEAGRAGAEAAIVGALASRLRIEAYWQAHPELAEAPVEGPILVTGLPRTGTTATVAMMALDPRFRFLRAWEAVAPLPPPVAGEEDGDPRALAARAAAANNVNMAMHLADPDGPEEDLVFLAGLAMRAYHGAFPMPESFTDWWTGADFAPVYRWHRKVLQILHSRRGPRRWLLKAPPHLFWLEQFVAEYPDCRIVMTHRDPAAVIASDSSLRWHLAAQRCDMAGLGKREFGPKLLKFWKTGMDRALAARARIGEERFVDVRNGDVAADPVASFEAVYAGLGMDVGPELRAAIAHYGRINAQGAHGEHRYTAEEYGLTRDSVRAAFADYIARFNL